MRARSLLGLAAFLALGCGSKDLVPVSGTVTLNGKPLVGATVTFLSVADEGSAYAGTSSLGKTDKDGHYSLQTTKGAKGARVGKYRVSISLLKEQVGDRDERRPRGGWKLADEVPTLYNEKTTLTFDVPDGGTDQADFPLTSP
jgi:hypothetical protein